jgi:hypothetical protein
MDGSVSAMGDSGGSEMEDAVEGRLRSVCRREFEFPGLFIFPPFSLGRDNADSDERE